MTLMGVRNLHCNQLVTHLWKMIPISSRDTSHLSCFIAPCGETSLDAVLELSDIARATKRTHSDATGSLLSGVSALVLAVCASSRVLFELYLIPR